MRDFYLTEHDNRLTDSSDSCEHGSIVVVRDAPDMSGTVLAPSFALLWKLLESEGIDPEPLFRAARIEPASLDDQNVRVPVSREEQLRQLVEERLQDSCVFLKFPNHFHPSQLGALGYAWLASSSLRTALNRLVRYSRIVNDRLDITLDEDESAGTLAVTIGWQGETVKFASRAEGAMAILVDLCRINYGSSLVPLSVSFTYPAPVCSAEYYALFRCPIEFGARENRIIFPFDVVDKRLSGSNPQIAQLNDRAAIDYLARLDKEDIIGRVKSTIIDQLPSGSITEESVAEAVYLTVRSLQRKLKTEGTSYRELLEDVRQYLANKYIKDSRLSVSEISFLLGFSETSAFSRAFKRWTGEPPSAHR